MATIARAKLSIKNKNYIDKHRYYELKHFCMQYNLWKQACLNLDGLHGQSFGHDIFRGSDFDGDKTFNLVAERISYVDRMKIIEQSAIETDPELSSYILKAVTEGLSYNHMRTKLYIPCCKDAYYERYRRFFWILDKKRD